MAWNIVSYKSASLPSLPSPFPLHLFAKILNQDFHHAKKFKARNLSLMQKGRWKTVVDRALTTCVETLWAKTDVNKNRKINVKVMYENLLSFRRFTNVENQILILMLILTFLKWFFKRWEIISDQLSWNGCRTWLACIQSSWIAEAGTS